jgi:ketosteroid isomerase-like protein
MRRPFVLTAVLLLASMPMGAQAAPTAADKSQTVLNLENAWNQAVAMHDKGALRGLLAETFVVTDSDGRFMDRDQWLGRARSETTDKRGPANITQTTHVYGDVVVVTGIILDKTRIKGKITDRRSRFTDTWIFQNDRWECIASQITVTES